MFFSRALLVGVLPAIIFALPFRDVHVREEPSLTKEHCGKTMCVYGVLHGDEVTYVMESKTEQFGYMAIGFGSKMANSPMVIAWTHDDQVILSQRKTPNHSMPQVDSDPPFEVKISPLTNAFGPRPRIAFTMPCDGNPSVQLIYASSRISPDSPDVDAPIQIHSDRGLLSFHLEED